MNTATTINEANATPVARSPMFDAACSLEDPSFKLGCLLRALFCMINQDTMPDERNLAAALELVLYAQDELEEIKAAHEILFHGLHPNQDAVAAKMTEGARND